MATQIFVNLTYTAAQTKTVIRSVASGKIFRPTRAKAFLKKGSTASEVGVWFYFDEATDRCWDSHPGIATGSGMDSHRGGAHIDEGTDGADILFSCADPSGTIDVYLSGYEIDV